MTVGTEQQSDLTVSEPWLAQTTSRLLSHFGPTASSGILSVIDQVVVSGGRFLTSIIIGRICGPLELGAYSLGFTLYCFAVCVQMALISLPFTLYAGRCHGERRRSYAGSSLVHFLTFSLVLTFTLGAAALVLRVGFGPAELAPLAGVLAFAFPLALLVEFARRWLLTRLEVRSVLIIDAAMATIQVVGLLVLTRLGLLSAATAYLAMGIAGGIAGLTWLAMARPHFLIRPLDVLADARHNWRNGRWMLVSQLTMVARTSLMLWLVALLLDATSTGIYVACDSLVRLASPLPIAVANVLFPSAANAFAAGDDQKVRRLVLQSTGVLIVAMAPICGMLILFGGLVLSALYGDAYSGFEVVAALIALTGIADAIDTGAGNGLFAIERPNVQVTAIVIGTATMLAVAAILIPMCGIVGAAIGALTGRVLGSSLQWIAFSRLSQRSLGRIT